MRLCLAQGSRPLCDALSRVSPWTPLPPRRRGRAAGRPSTLTLGLCHPRRSCPYGATVHSSCRRQRRQWGAALAAGALLTKSAEKPRHSCRGGCPLGQSRRRPPYRNLDRRAVRLAQPGRWRHLRIPLHRPRDLSLFVYDPWRPMYDHSVSLPSL